MPGNVSTSTTGMFNHGFSIESIYQSLASYIKNYEGELASSIQGMGGTTGENIDQGTLLNIQAKVQTWGTIVSTATGIVRAIGDGLKSTTQNIR
ncbi:MAG: hypothetical protein LBJ94_02935 [Puniceicoccales bacterium]|jgi:hypothetical protein|nr:hypothetical protein [Puniceicoccales bacterium]